MIGDDENIRDFMKLKKKLAKKEKTKKQKQKKSFFEKLKSSQ